jgi:hypothetical protein
LKAEKEKQKTGIIKPPNTGLGLFFTAYKSFAAWQQIF